jgi:hypothetical protein
MLENSLKIYSKKRSNILFMIFLIMGIRGFSQPIPKEPRDIIIRVTATDAEGTFALCPFFLQVID